MLLCVQGVRTWWIKRERDTHTHALACDDRSQKRREKKKRKNDVFFLFVRVFVACGLCASYTAFFLFVRVFVACGLCASQGGREARLVRGLERLQVHAHDPLPPQLVRGVSNASGSAILRGPRMHQRERHPTLFNRFGPGRGRRHCRPRRRRSNGACAVDPSDSALRLRAMATHGRYTAERSR
jgi:hypothetical protein